MAAMLLFFGQWWTGRSLYVGLALMVGVSLWDLMSPATRRCSRDGCEAPQMGPPNRARARADREASPASAMRK